MKRPAVIATIRNLLLLLGGMLVMGQWAMAAGLDQSITFVFISDKTYGDAPFGVRALASSGLDVTFSIVSGPATVAGTNVTITGAGTVAVVATQAGNATWNPAAATNIFHVAPAILTVVADDKSKTYGTANPAFSYNVFGFVNGENAGVVSGNPSYTSSATITSPVGSYDIEPALGTLHATNYTFDFADGRLAVLKASLTVAAEAKSKVFGQSDPTLSYHITVGALVGSDSFTGSLVRTAGENVGNYPITQGTLTAGTNYTMVLAGTNLTITPVQLVIVADAQTKVYAESDPPLTYQIFSGALVGADTLTGSLTRAAGETVGNRVISQGSLTASGNYAITFISANLAITPATLTVAANDASRRYGATNPVFTYLISGFVNGENAVVVSGTPTLTTVATSSSPIGIYSIEPDTGTLSATNYAFEFVEGRLAIMTAKLTIAADAQAKLYGDADPALTYQITSGVLFGADALTGNLARNVGESVGAYAITQNTLSAGTNYTITYVGTNLAISPVVLTVTTENKERAYGAANPEFTYTVTGFVNGEDESVLTGAPDFSTVADSESVVGDYVINIDVGSLAATNYTFALYDGALSVTPVQLTLTADAKNKTYGTADPGLTYQINTGALVGTDTITGSLLRAAGENVGSYAISQNTVDAGSNYEITFVGANLVISAASVAVTADVQAKTYGTVDPSLTYQITSGALVGTDAFSGSLARTAGENVGAYAINQGTLTAGANYNLIYAGTNLTIVPAVITVAADAKSKTYGAVDPGLTFEITSGALVGTDAITGLLSRVAGENTGTYAINQGTLTAGTNYYLTFVTTNLTIIPASVAESIVSSRNSAPSGANVTFTATLSAIAPGAGIPSGVVQFIVDGSPYGSPLTLTNAAASTSTSALAHGYHTVVAVYAGSTNFLGNTNALNQLINRPPVAFSDSASTYLNAPVTGASSALLANDSDGDLDAITVTSVSATSFMGGTVSLGGGTWAYTPPSNFSGIDAFAYSVSDSYGETATSFVIVTVIPAVSLPARVVSLEPLANGSKLLTFSGTSGVGYVVQASTNLTAWLPLSTNTCGTNGLFLFTDTGATNYSSRFYRSVSQ